MSRRCAWLCNGEVERRLCRADREPPAVNSAPSFPKRGLSKQICGDSPLVCASFRGFSSGEKERAPGTWQSQFFEPANCKLANHRPSHLSIHSSIHSFSIPFIIVPSSCVRCGCLFWLALLACLLSQPDSASASAYCSRSCRSFTVVASLSLPGRRSPLSHDRCSPEATNRNFPTSSPHHPPTWRPSPTADRATNRPRPKLPLP